MKFRNINIIIIFILSFTYTSLIGYADEKNYLDQNLVTDVNLIIESKSPQFENQTEKEIVFRQMYGFLYYVQEFEGRKQWRKFITDYKETKSITLSFLNIYHKTIYEMAGFISYKLDKRMMAKEKEETVSKNIHEFKLIFSEKSKVEEDLPYIEYLIENYHQGLVETFLVNDAIADRYLKNIDNLFDKNIKIYLMTDTQTVKQQFGKVTGVAATLVGYKICNENSAKVNARLLFKYKELFTASAFVHELTHVFWAFCYIDPVYTGAIPIDLSQNEKNRLKQAFAPFSDQNPLKEGVAEFVSAKYNLLCKYNIIEDVDYQLSYYFHKEGKGFNLNELATRIYKVKDQAPTYEIAHSVFKYIVTCYGMEKALELSYSGQKKEDYLRILGKDIDSLSSEWNGYIFSLEDR